jgi:hypothetical protein
MSIMEISKLRTIGEGISVVAVLVTLVFLILEVRENTAAIRTESFGESINKLNEWRLNLAGNRELAQMFADFNDGAVMELDRAERQQFGLVMTSLWSIYETAYFAQSYGTLGESEWSRFERVLCSQYESAVAFKKGLWDTEVQMILSPEFRLFVEEQCG